MQNTHSHTQLDTLPPPPARKCPLGKFRSSILHGAHGRTGQHPFGGPNPVLPEWRTQIVCHAARPGKKIIMNYCRAYFFYGR